MGTQTIRARDLTHEHIGSRFHFGFWAWEDYIEGAGELVHLEWSLPYLLVNGKKSWHHHGPVVTVDLEDGDDESTFCLDPNDTLTVL